MNTNGRVNITEHVTGSVFNLYDKIPIDDKATTYKNALKGNLEESLLSMAFFSANNIIILQNAIVAGVYHSSNGTYKIGYQNEDTLKIIMRSIYLQHSSNLNTHITEQITALNKLVTDYCVPQICGEAAAYMKYKSDVSSLAVPLQRPVSTYNNNLLEITHFFGPSK